uniref:Uncharacterized protein n=1 Tax=Romanomermis culicivorax TaxID=13658 RepID=A0A915IDQ3_ROMCU
MPINSRPNMRYGSAENRKNERDNERPLAYCGSRPRRRPAAKMAHIPALNAGSLIGSSNLLQLQLCQASLKGGFILHPASSIRRPAIYSDFWLMMSDEQDII